jgi:putative spermidine/putrescine transport system substrate-binding protein
MKPSITMVVVALIIGLIVGAAPAYYYGTTVATSDVTTVTRTTTQTTTQTVTVSEPPEPLTIVFAGFPGAWEGTFKDTSILSDFESQFNAIVIYEPGRGSDHIAKLRIQKDAPTIDVVFSSSSTQIDAEKDGLVIRLTEDDIPNMKDLHPISLNPNRYAPAFANTILGLGYSTDTVTETPTSWNVLLDPQYEGLVGLFHSDHSVGASALIMFSLLRGGSQTNIDPAFEFLEDLQPNVGMVQKTTTPVINALNMGEIAFVTSSAGTLVGYMKEGAPIGVVVPEEGTVGQQFYVAVVANLPPEREEMAKNFVNYLLSMDVQGRWTRASYYIPSNMYVKAPEEYRDIMSLDLLDKTVMMDSDHYGTVKAEWAERMDTLFGA